MSHIIRDGQTYEVVTFGEALRRLGMDGRVRDAQHHHDELVAYAPRVVADPGTGRLFSICSGRVLYAFCVVRKADHLPDEPWSWRETNRSLYVVVDTDREIGWDAWLKCVVPG